MKRPSYISPYEWDNMSEAEQREELELLAHEDTPHEPVKIEPLAAKREPRPERLKWSIVKPRSIHDAFAYDADTGLIYKRATQRANLKGYPDRVLRSPYPAGTVHPLGFVVVKYQGRQWYAHRLAWVLMTGKEPTGQLKHLNGNRADNRWANLTQWVRVCP